MKVFFVVFSLLVASQMFASEQTEYKYEDCYAVRITDSNSNGVYYISKAWFASEDEFGAFEIEDSLINPRQWYFRVNYHFSEDGSFFKYVEGDVIARASRLGKKLKEKKTCKEFHNFLDPNKYSTYRFVGEGDDF